MSYRSGAPVALGTLVRVPLGRRSVTGIVDEALTSPAEAELRSIEGVMDSIPPLPRPWISLCRFASEYYLRAFGELALAVLPTQLRQLSSTAVASRVRRLARSLSEPGEPVVAVMPPTLALNPGQADALEAIAVARQQPAPGVILLHGVTGSGKTEVYLRAASDVLADGGRVLVLVPEINLTPQLVERFAAHFGVGRIAVMHSGLTPAARLQQWLRAHLGHADVVLGTRLAVFASLPGLRLIVVDEEHDPSYKQQEGARYSARDLAVWRGRSEQALVVLGSATPALESWHRAVQGRYRLATLPQRIGGAGWPT
ncbi:MAG: DEAD/DEAH box helicase, partial [Pseudomonadota bacterium]|nr:DEAD/DEAH box helicase [Pseudomonadota bacterium]